MSTRSEIGARIRVLRETLQLTRSELAKLCDLSPSAIQGWEEKGGVPHGKVMERAAKALGVSVRYLVTGRREAPTSAPADPQAILEIIDRARKEIADLTGIPERHVQLKLKYLRW